MDFARGFLREKHVKKYFYKFKIFSKEYNHDQWSDLLLAGQPTKKWLKTNEVCKILGVSITTLLTLRINGILPYSKIGGCLYFDYEDILKVMDENKQLHGTTTKTRKFYRLG